MKLIGILAVGLLFSLTMASSKLVIVGDNHENILELIESVLKGDQTLNDAFNFFNIDGSMVEMQEVLKDMPKDKIMSLPLNDDMKDKLIAGMNKISEVVGSDNGLEVERKHIKMNVEQLLNNKHLVDSNKKNVIILNSHKATNGKRLLDQEIIVQPYVSQSQILDDITPYAVSGILISIFLTIALVVGFKCLLDLKTNDRFPRNMYQVGKES